MIDAQLIVDYAIPLLGVVGVLQVLLVVLIAKRLQGSVDSNRTAITRLMVESLLDLKTPTKKPKKKPTKKKRQT